MDHRLRVGDRLGPASDLDSSGSGGPSHLVDAPRIELDHVVHDDRGPTAAGDVPDLLRVVEVETSDIDRIEFGFTLHIPDRAMCGVLSFPTVATRAGSPSPRRTRTLP